MSDCPPCNLLDCPSPDELSLYSINGGRVFNNPDFSFYLDCPAGYTCQPGFYPHLVSVPAGSLPQIIVQPTVGVYDTGPVRIQGCTSEIAREVPIGSTDSEIAAIVQSLFRDAAIQQALCLNLQSPAPGVAAPRKR